MLYAYKASRVGATVHYLYGDDLIVGILYPLTGAFLVRRRPRNAVGWVLVLASVLGVNAPANQYAVAGLASLAAWPTRPAQPQLGRAGIPGRARWRAGKAAGPLTRRQAREVRL